MDDRWLVMDNLDANEPHHYALHWLLSDVTLECRSLLLHNGLWLPTITDSKLSDSRINIQMGLIEGNGNSPSSALTPTPRAAGAHAITDTKNQPFP